MDLLGSAGVDEELRTDAPHMIEGSAEHREESRRDVQHEERSEDRSRVATGLVRQRDDRVHDEGRHLGADEHIELSDELLIRLGLGHHERSYEQGDHPERGDRQCRIERYRT